MKKGISPTQRSLAYLRKHRHLTAVVERWNPHAHIRQDLFGCIDLLAVPTRDPVLTPMPPLIAVQTTTSDNLAARVTKLGEAKVKLGEEEVLVLPLLLGAGWTVEVHGWRKLITKKNRWHVRIYDMRTNTERDG